ncbi:MAG: aminotransferase class V-fold PLP-dependent enzyme [Legionellales bacterium]|nr:aminotransferase class V-fold PLP-dependent enzyme [Legionellales bacterium]
MNIGEIRKNYPITEQDNYLNHAATAPISYASIQRMQAVAAEMARPLNEHFYVWLGILEDTRRRIADLIHAHPSEIAFCQNTSTGLSLIASAVPFEPGDKVLVPRNEFPSNIYIWQSLSKKGVQFEFFDVLPGVPVVQTLASLNLKKVRLMSISAVSYLTGRCYELQEIAQFCRERGILSCFDAIQAIGAIPFDVRTIQPDFVASGSQKWLLGSVGAGFVYARKEWLEQLTVPLVGWTSVQYPENFSLKKLEYSREMTRFEPGLPDVLPIVALNQSLRDFAQIGWDNIYARIGSHTQYLSQALQDHQIDVLAKEDLGAGIVAFDMPKRMDLDHLLTRLKKHKIHLTQRDEYLRISPHIYNTKEELDTLLTILSTPAHKAFIVPAAPDKPNVSAQSILISGASGHLGSYFAKDLATQGYHLTLLGKSQQKLDALQHEIQQTTSVTITLHAVDFNDPNSMQTLLTTLDKKPGVYTAFINCAGISESDEFIHLPVKQIAEMFQINCVAAFQLMQLFVTRLHAPQALGILNIVSPTGRCGWPLLSGYAASQAALWSFTEVLARELSHPSEMTVTTYVAPPMHSSMQKRLGRIALRYFKLSGEFPYKQAQEIAKHAWDVFRNKETLHIHLFNRWTLRLNAWIPAFLNKRIRKIWKSA